jgi:hypothetical protein
MISAADMDHDNLIVVHYNEFAGGKFFINCLAHHPSVLPGLDIYFRYQQDSWSLEHQLHEQVEMIKIQAINASVPPVQDMKNWTRYELGCENFWGAPLYKLMQNRATSSPFAGGVNALQNYICFIVNHVMSMQQFASITKLWPRARHIILHNSDRFRRQSLQLKSQRTFLIGSNALDADLPRSFYVDVDTTWGDLSKIKTCVADCVRWLDLELNMHANLDSYIQRYISLYQSGADVSLANS